VQLPQSFITSLEDVEGFDKEAFIRVHQSGEQVTSIRINPLKKYEIGNSKYETSRVLWTEYGYYLSQRPSFTFDPLFHAGCYYVQEASSMFLEQALRQTVELSQPLKVLDLCAAPGGKSTHIQSLLTADSLLVSNDVIKARVNVLRQNIIKWGATNVIVTNNDPQHFARLEGFFDVIVVDAPCSGSGLFRRDEAAINEWSIDNVQLCCGRQRRILADALPALKEEGVLIYSTCSYSREEDEEIMDWLVGECGMENVELRIEKDWNIIPTVSKTGAEGYRFYPDKVRGEGFFISCFRKQESRGRKYKTAKPELATAKEKSLLDDYLNSKSLDFYKLGNTLFALPKIHAEAFAVLQANLYLQYAGTTIGEIMKNKLVPDHALAVSTILSDTIPRFELNATDAVKYLQRADILIDPPVKGWQIVTYENQPLGWINALSNRINNYYPKEMRILKQHNDNAFEKK
jgi:16S rRNA C967 or C1407 C5-methylase (RsmB/RsmF family)/NOL1/NOP2/fmu family ribosome biogenesis protein